MKPYGKSLGDRLRWLRRRHDLSLEDFGKGIRVGKSYLSKLERGINESPSEHVLDAICRMYFVSREWLMAGNGEVFTLPHLNEWPASKPIEKPFTFTSTEPEKTGNLLAFVAAGTILDSSRSAISIAIVINSITTTPRFTPELTIAVVKILSHELLAQLVWLEKECGGNLSKSYSDYASNEGRLAIIAAQEAKKIEKWKTPDEITIDTVHASVNTTDVKAQWPTLKTRLKKATVKAGSKTMLAKFLGVKLASVSQWLSDSDSAREPGAETTLRMLHYVEQQERKR